MYCWLLAALPLWAQPAPAVAAPSPTNQPLNVTAERIDHLQEQDIYEADGSVVITQGPFKLTADHVTIKSLPGTLIATGHVHLVDPTSDIRSDQLELNVNTEAGVVTTGSLYVKLSNSYLAGRLLQRMSEDHYRIKDGTFTNCDAGEGETPAWRFKFEDLDVRTGESVAMKRGWLCMNDARILPIPTLTYPLNNRHSGFLIPTPGYDNRFGLHYQPGYFWAINPSQDMTISPSYYSNLGYGSDFAYRYYLDRRSRGEWFASVLQQTKLPNVSGVDQAGGGEQRLRGIFSGTHVQQVTDTLLIRGQASFVSDRTYLQQLSNSGAQRASPSGESSLLATQRLPYGNAYLLGQFLQPLNFGGPDTFQRLPEVGYVLPNTSPFGLPFLVNMDTNFVNFFREQGFGVNRMDFTPGLATDVIDVGHLVGFTPQFKFKEVYYTRGIESSDAIHRETFWASLDATSKLSRRYTGSEGGSLLHTIEPSVMYEYVPGSDQSKIAQIDQIDDLPKKLADLCVAQPVARAANQWSIFQLAGPNAGPELSRGGGADQGERVHTRHPAVFGIADPAASAGHRGGTGAKDVRSLDAGRHREHSPGFLESARVPADAHEESDRRADVASDQFLSYRGCFLGSLSWDVQPVEHGLAGAAVQLLVCGDRTTLQS
ncbi:MAG: LPS assembly protein LptD [Nitrospiraceae bacterium]